ncbi:unnamed protein product, partial [Closterium sp. NIES-54]
MSHLPFPLPEPGTNRHPMQHKVYSDFLVIDHCGLNDQGYMLAFVDAGTHYVWIANIQFRTRAYEVFRLWLAHAQRQSGKKLQIWQTDGAAEFRSKELHDYLARKGILHHISLPFARPQQGVAERTICTLMTKVRALLKQSNLPSTYWSYTLHHAMRVHNLLSTAAIIDNLSPHMKWTGKEGNTSMLCVWGCMVLLVALHARPSLRGAPPPPLPPPMPLLLPLTSLVLRTSGLLLLVRSAAAARARVAGVVAEAAGVVVGAAVAVVEAVEVVAAVEAAVGVAAVAAVGVVVVGLQLSVEVLEVARGSSSSVGARPSRPSSFVSGCFSVGRLGVVVAAQAATTMTETGGDLGGATRHQDGGGEGGDGDGGEGDDGGGDGGGGDG